MSNDVIVIKKGLSGGNFKAVKLSNNNSNNNIEEVDLNTGNDSVITVMRNNTQGYIDKSFIRNCSVYNSYENATKGKSIDPKTVLWDYIGDEKLGNNQGKGMVEYTVMNDKVLISENGTPLVWTTLDDINKSNLLNQFSGAVSNSANVGQGAASIYMAYNAGRNAIFDEGQASAMSDVGKVVFGAGQKSVTDTLDDINKSNVLNQFSGAGSNLANVVQGAQNAASVSKAMSDTRNAVFSAGQASGTTTLDDINKSNLSGLGSNLANVGQNVQNKASLSMAMSAASLDAQQASGTTTLDDINKSNLSGVASNVDNGVQGAQDAPSVSMVYNDVRNAIFNKGQASGTGGSDGSR